MSATAEELKARARDLLPPQVASSVATAIEQDAERLVRLGSPARDLASAKSKSAFTAFLGDAFYRDLAHGRMSGRPTVQWNGMDSFMFIEDGAAPFSYTTAKGRVIRPRSMATDGGTIPRLLHALRSFSPWGYGPAYIIHDWLFTAHRHNLAPDHDWHFEDTATALAECIKSLMEDGFVAADSGTVRLARDEDGVYLIYQAVRSTFAKEHWDA